MGELVDGVDCQTRCKSDFMMIVQLLTYVVQKSLAMRSEHLKSNWWTIAQSDVEKLSFLIFHCFDSWSVFSSLFTNKVSNK